MSRFDPNRYQDHLDLERQLFQEMGSNANGITVLDVRRVLRKNGLSDAPGQLAAIHASATSDLNVMKTQPRAVGRAAAAAVAAAAKAAARAAAGHP